MFRTLIIPSSLCILFLAGCGDGGPALSPVSGTVTVDGTPKPRLLVTFVPKSRGAGAIGQTNDKGEFRLNTNGRPGAIPGEYTVSITTVKEASSTSVSSASGSAPSGSEAYMNQGKINPKDYKMPQELIPERYNTKSDLIRLVETTKNTFDFELTTK